MPQITIENLLIDIAEFEKQKAQHIGNLNAVEGAIIYARGLIKFLSTEEPVAEIAKTTEDAA